jgi:hypothetical protein
MQEQVNLDLPNGQTLSLDSNDIMAEYDLNFNLDGPTTSYRVIFAGYNLASKELQFKLVTSSVRDLPIKIKVNDIGGKVQLGEANPNITLVKVGGGVKIEIKNKGALSKFGYSSKAPRKTRRAAIRKAVQSYGATSTFRKLNALSVFNKRTQKHKLFKNDRDWVKKTFMKV